MRRVTPVLATMTAAVLALSACGTDGNETYNNADVEYAGGMIAHHQQAIEMSDIVLASDGIDAEVAELAQQIKQAQGPEIEQMTLWFEQWDADMGSHAEHLAMGHAGILSEDELAELEAAQGDEAARLFLEQMIEHHEGAVEMAEQHLDEGQNPEALELSANVIADQNAEIDLMRDMLTTR